MDLVEALGGFAGQLGLGMYPLPPRSGVLGGYAPDLGQLRRDAQGIVVQHEAGNPTAALDGGDSAHKTGICALCNSSADQALLDLFENGDGIMVRHPTQFPWNNWKNCSRDQLVAYSAGCWRAGKTDINKRLLEKHAGRLFTCQNTEDNAPGTTKVPPVGDLMAPHDVMALRIAAGDDGAYLDLLGQFSLQAAIELADRDVEVEKNQLIAQSILCGRLNLYVAAHPNFRDNIRYYWSRWRDQAQIAEAYIQTIELVVSRGVV